MEGLVSKRLRNIECRKDQFEEVEVYLLAMEEINQRREELKVLDKEWHAVCMLIKIQKRKGIVGTEYN